MVTHLLMLESNLCSLVSKYVKSWLAEQKERNTVQKIKISIKDFFRKLRIWSHLLKKSLMENFIFCAVKYL